MRRPSPPKGAAAPSPDGPTTAGTLLSSASPTGVWADIAHVALRVVFRVPVVGWMLREAVEGGAESRRFFACNLAMLAAFAVLAFGVQALLVIALALVPIAFISILIMASG